MVAEQVSRAGGAEEFVSTVDHHLVEEVKAGFEAMLKALTDYRERIKELEGEVHTIRKHCEVHCPLCGGNCPLVRIKELQR